MQKNILNKKQLYAKEVEHNFLANIMKDWKKRNHKLLHIGINHAIEPCFFWDLGFEVTAYAQNLEELEESQKKNGKMIEYSLGVVDHLSFEDNTFDYVVLTHTFASNTLVELPSHSRTQNLKHVFSKKSAKNKKIDYEYCFLEQIIHESVRVCANSVLIVENSSFAFDILSPALSPLYLHQICEKADQHKHELHFALSVPSLLWLKSKTAKSCYAMPHKVPFGSLIALQIDISQEVMTSLPSYVSYAVEDI